LLDANFGLLLRRQCCTSRTEKKMGVGQFSGKSSGRSASAL